LANAIFLILQWFNWDPLHIPVKGDRESLVGFMDCENSVSAMIAFCFPAFLRGRWKWGLPLILVGFVLSKTFGGVLAVVCTLLFLVFQHFRHWRIRSILIILCASLLMGYSHFIDPPDPNWRLKTWKSSVIEFYPQHPWIGFGIGHFKTIYSHPKIIGRTFRTSFQHAHNELVQGLVEMGPLLLIVVFGYIVSVLRRYRSLALLPFLSLIIIFVNSMVFFPFHIALTAMVALSWMAVLENSLSDDTRKLRFQCFS